MLSLDLNLVWNIINLVVMRTHLREQSRNLYRS